MKHLLLLLVVFVSVSFGPVTVASEEQKSVNCETGPLTKEYGKTSWLVYSCDDNKSMLIISAIDNPAMPYYFTLQESKKGYLVIGAGSGDKKTTAAAFADLEKLSQSEILKLIKKTKTIKARVK